MTAPFQPPTALEIAERFMRDPAFAAVVAEYVAAEVEHATTYMSGTEGGRSIRALMALYEAFPGAAAAATEQHRLYLATKAAA